ncbi:MAG: hypothetical protein M5U26_05540 [Planctomycetota bacterium]|nr:hypothetical protein [Planctomycetota bacterium]
MRCLRFAVLPFLVLLCGCQEFQGPVWSPDGEYIAYTTYERPQKSGEPVDTAVYSVDVRVEDSEALLISRDAAFPRWVPDGPTLYFAGERNKQGFFASICRHRPGEAPPDALQYVTVLDKLRLTGFQMAVDGSVALLAQGRSFKPGEPQKVELWYPAKNERVNLTQKGLGEVYSPALSPSGKILAFGASDKRVLEGKPYVAALELDRPELKPEILFPTAQYGEPSATTYVVHAFPDSLRFFFYAPGSDAVWTVLFDGTQLQRYSLPKGFSSPLMVSIREDGRSATLTLSRPTRENVEYHVYELDFRKSKLNKLDGDSAELLGGHALDPMTVRRRAPERWAWLSAGGLAVGVAGKARYFPKSSEQAVAASGFLLAQGDAARALQYALKARDYKPAPADPGVLDRTEARAYLASGDGVRASEAFERAILLHPVTPDGLRFIFPPDRGLPQQAGADAEVLVKEMEAYAAANEKDVLLIKLREALLARVKGDGAAALAAYQAAQNVAPDEALAGGIRFLNAMTYFESGDMVHAGESFEIAARVKVFPQRDYAAGLAAICFALDGRPDSAQRANAALAMARDLKSPLADDLQKLTRELGGRPFKSQRLSNEQKSPDKAMRSWVDITEYLVPQAFLQPRRLLTPAGEYDARRLCVALVTSSSIQVAGLPEGTQTLLRLPCPISVPIFSPGNDLLAFRAEGEVFPLPDQFCEVYVIDLRGNILLGDARAALNGDLRRREVIENVSWSNPRELHLKGAYIDAFGNQTRLDKTQALGGK